MLILFFVILFSFFIYIKDGYGKLSQMSVSKTDLLVNQDEIIRFAGISFKGSMFGFFIDNNRNNGRDVSIVYSSFPDNTWKTKYNVLSSPTDYPSLISSIFVDEEEIIVIFRSDTAYFLSRSSDGMEWTSPKEIITEQPLPLVFSFYSGSLLNQTESNQKIIFTCANDVDDAKKEVSETQVIMICAFSYDKGNSWTIQKFTTTEKEEKTIFAEKIFFANNQLYILSILDYTTEVYFVCLEITKDNNSCIMNSSEVAEDYEIDTIFETNGYVMCLKILYNEFAYLCKLIENGKCHFISEVPVGRNYNVIANDNNGISIVIEKAYSVDLVQFCDKQDTYVPYNASEISVRDITEEIL